MLILISLSSYPLTHIHILILRHSPSPLTSPNQTKHSNIHTSPPHKHQINKTNALTFQRLIKHTDIHTSPHKRQIKQPNPHIPPHKCQIKRVSSPPGPLWRWGRAWRRRARPREAVLRGGRCRRTPSPRGRWGGTASPGASAGSQGDTPPPWGQARRSGNTAPHWGQGEGVLFIYLFIYYHCHC